MDAKDQCSLRGFPFLLGLGLVYVGIVGDFSTTKDCRQHGQGVFSRLRRLESHDTMQS